MPESTLHGMFLNKFAAETEVDCQQFVVWDFKSPILKKKNTASSFLCVPFWQFPWHCHSYLNSTIKEDWPDLFLTREEQSRALQQTTEDAVQFI